MTKITELRTERLHLRQWTDADLIPFAKLNADPEVMAHFPKPLSTNQSNEMAKEIRALIEENGWGAWAVELTDTKEFIGITGLHQPTFPLPVSPCTEILWRFSKEHWGKGYTTEAAHAALKFGFETLDLHDIYAFTSLNNLKSVAVMQRLGMKNTHSNFLHPELPEGHPLRAHILYKISTGAYSNILKHH